jgi:hypothetical protein
LKFNRIKPDFRKTSLEINGQFWYPFGEFADCAKKPTRLPLSRPRDMLCGGAIQTEKEAA